MVIRVIKRGIFKTLDYLSWFIEAAQLQICAEPRGGQEMERVDLLIIF